MYSGFKNKIPFILLAILFIANIAIFWPGQMSPDSITQYNQAISGNFSDHHPPIMAALWRLFIKTCPGVSIAGTMLIFHMSLLYIACLIFMITFKDTKFVWYYLLYPIFLPILLYSSMIWKDVGFAFGYLLLCASITYFTFNKKRPNIASLFVMFIVMFYATAVKFQAQFTLPVMALCIACVSNNFKLNLKTVFYSIVTTIAILGAVNIFDYRIIKAEKSNSWKFVKIYDLAGVSLQLGRPLFPEYILHYNKFSMDLMRQKFNYERVDDIVFFADSPIPRIESAQDRNALLRIWYKTIFWHPILYAKHRYKNWSRILWSKPLEKLEKLNFNDFDGLKWFAKFQAYNKFIFIFLSIIRYLCSFIFVFIFTILYLLFGAISMHKKFGFILFAFSLSSLLLVLALFPFSMASSLRYVYMSVCLIHACHPIAYMLYKDTL